ncbi:methyl-accepting chemotaxis protein [Paenibacillus filicis]|uniref:Methyl-accepting chemotaxis protein n=1 Tax=Paenibacillus filicis TaxID=669464 RepID=A0ABU9DKD7_9BACL
MKLTIGKKLYGSFSVILIFLIVLGIIAYTALARVVGSYEDMIGRRASLLILMKDIQVKAIEQNSSLKEYLLMGSESSKNKTVASNTETSESITRAMELAKLQDHKDLLAELSELNGTYLELAKTVMAASTLKQGQDIATQNTFPIGLKIASDAKKLADDQQKLMDEGAAANSKLIEGANTLLVITILLSIVVSAVLGTYISRHLSRPIVALSQAARRIASGDLRTTGVSVSNKDELGELALSFGRMGEELRGLIRQIQDSVEHTAASSEQLTASSGQSAESASGMAGAIRTIAAGSGMQAASADECATAMQEMASGLQRIAESSADVADMAAHAMSRVDGGHTALQLTIDRMDSILETVQSASGQASELDAHSKQIGQIVGLIADISQQTNLLALNASIEAARAGEHGKGFAVVAEEVKNLAAQTKESAGRVEHIIRLIRDSTGKIVEAVDVSVQEVRTGSQAVNEAGEAFTEIREAMRSAVHQIQEVSASSEEVSAGSEQVLAAVEEVSRISRDISEHTRQAAAATEEQLASMEQIATSASGLSELAQTLQTKVRTFTIE